MYTLYISIFWTQQKLQNVNNTLQKNKKRSPQKPPIEKTKKTKNNVRKKYKYMYTIYIYSIYLK